ncbi:hypothetical protein L596_005971 [Steinernema carpocapsae]|uniref:Uncharacterized protein n=1 Tax=Steinernema carpocapsae TaxID=34508 RepID=A0A4U8V290_STECR|nr:hypothetical protein L596_005971 [Steinernema carpocapsae]
MSNDTKYRHSGLEARFALQKFKLSKLSKLRVGPKTLNGFMTRKRGQITKMKSQASEKPLKGLKEHRFGHVSLIRRDS